MKTEILSPEAQIRLHVRCIVEHLKAIGGHISGIFRALSQTALGDLWEALGKVNKF